MFLRSKGREGTEYAKYSPSSDLHLDNSYGIPLLIGEIVSEPSEEDRERMLLQAVGLVRVARCFCKNPAIMAVYFDNEYLAARYIAYTDKMDEKKVLNALVSMQKLFLMSSLDTNVGKRI